jgi:putative zinc finger protein
MSTATTHAWLRRVSDYHSGGVSVAERAAVEAHLAECGECRLALATYQRLYVLASSPLGLGGGDASPLAEFSASILAKIPITLDHGIGDMNSRRRPHDALTTLGAIAAVLVIALLATALFAHFRRPAQPAAPHPTPTLDAPTRAYVQLLRAYYVPLADANSPVITCLRIAANVERTAQAQQMATCRAPLLTELAAAQTFATQIATATPPIAWQSSDATLKQAAPRLVTLLSTQIADIDAGDIAALTVSQETGTHVLYLFLAPINQFNATIGAGPPPRTPPLPILNFLYQG